MGQAWRSSGVTAAPLSALPEPCQAPLQLPPSGGTGTLGNVEGSGAHLGRPRPRLQGAATSVTTQGFPHTP